MMEHNGAFAAVSQFTQGVITRRMSPISPSRAERPSRISSWAAAAVLAHVRLERDAQGSVYAVFKQAEDVAFRRLTRSEWDSRWKPECFFKGRMFKKKSVRLSPCLHFQPQLDSGHLKATSMHEVTHLAKSSLI